jgi:hypothetical protein
MVAGFDSGEHLTTKILNHHQGQRPLTKVIRDH